MTWTHETLADVAEVLGGQSPPSVEVNEAGLGLPFFQGKAEFGARHPTPRKWCATPARTAAPGDVLLSIRAPVGPTNVAVTHCGIGRGLAAVRAGPRTNSAWLTYWIQFSADELRKKATGSTFEAVTIGQVKAHPIPVPAVDEQHRIVAAIETHFSRLDAAVASLTRAKANVKRARASVLKAAVEGRLVPTEAALARAEGRDYESAVVLLDRILAERKAAWAASGARGKYKEPVNPEAEGLPGLPEGWCWATMPQIGELDRGKSKHRPRNDPRLLGGPYPFVQTGDVRRANGYIRDFTATYSEFGLAQSRLWPVGTLCITIAANIAETAILAIDACFPDSVVGFCGAVEPIVVRFLELFLRTARDRLAEFAPATAQKNINLQILRSVAIRLPPLAEQHRIVAEVDRRLSVLDALDTTLDANLARCDRLRQAVLKRAFEGRLVPAEADAPLLAAEPQMPLFAQDARS